MDVKNFRFKDKDGNVLYEFPITGVAPDITVTASVDNNIGTPSVTVTKSGENDAPTYQLDFKNLRVAPDITVSASVDNNIGIPSVKVTKSGENDAPAYQLDFKNLKGDQGIQGIQGIQGVQGPAVPIDTTLSTTSNNAIANSAVTTEFNKIDTSLYDKSNKPKIANLALISNDILAIELNNIDDVANQPYYFSGEISNIVNVPDVGNVGAFVFERIVNILSNTFANVELHEFHPVSGRIWSITYNNGWGLWHSTSTS